MSENQSTRRWLSSGTAVFAGILATVIPSVGSDAVMHATGVFPPVGQPMSHALFAVALAYRLVYGVAGGYVTARLAPARPMLHAIVLGTIGLVASIAGAIAMWDAGPAWYPLAIIATAIPCAWLGGRLQRLGRDRFVAEPVSK